MNDKTEGALVGSLRALARAEHDDLSIGDEAAYTIERQAEHINDLQENGQRLVEAADSWKEQCLTAQGELAEARGLNDAWEETLVERDAKIAALERELTERTEAHDACAFHVAELCDKLRQADAKIAALEEKRKRTGHEPGCLLNDSQPHYEDTCTCGFYDADAALQSKWQTE